MSHQAHYAPHIVLKHENIKAMGHEEVGLELDTPRARHALITPLIINPLT